MANVISKGSNFDAHLVAEMINKVKGHSSIATMVANEPVAFNGNKYFTFNYDNEVDLVAENGAKSNGGGTVAPITINPIKIEYGMRVSDEFMYASEEERVNYLQAFTEGFAKKMAKGLDLMAMHGINPRTNTVSPVISAKSFDTMVTNTVAYDGSDPDGSLESAIKLVEDADYEVNGIAISPTLRKDLATLKNADDTRLYPDFAFGGKPTQLGGSKLDVNGTVSKAVKQSTEASALAVDQAILGYFEMFKWGYGKEISLEVIEYGNPDNDAQSGDLKGHNQVYLRAEAYIGWAIFDANAFARVTVA